jgi:hypothetical protein
VHNPYDGNNYVTSVHPDYYSDKLKKHTDLLAYIPYFVSQLSMSEHFYTLPAINNYDRVFVQSDRIRRDHLKYWPPEKIVALGSPKFDKVTAMGKASAELPDEWRDIIAGRKTVLYNTSVASILRGGEAYLEKLRSVIKSFENKTDLALWWRPHPLSAATYSSMRARLYREYMDIEETFKKQRLGVFDDTSGLHRAIAASDAYYGDGSSVVCLYELTGKPIAFQWVLEEFSAEELAKTKGNPLWEDGELFPRFLPSAGQPYRYFADYFAKGESGETLKQRRAALQIANNLDGTAGEKIHKYIMEIMNK